MRRGAWATLDAGRITVNVTPSSAAKRGSIIAISARKGLSHFKFIVGLLALPPFLCFEGLVREGLARHALGQFERIGKPTITPCVREPGFFIFGFPVCGSIRGTHTIGCIFISVLPSLDWERPEQDCRRKGEEPSRYGSGTQYHYRNISSQDCHISIDNGPIARHVAATCCRRTRLYYGGSPPLQ